MRTLISMTSGTRHYPECPVNHEGSATTMEAEGVLILYKRSEEKYNLRFTTFRGDGDCHSYHKVKEAQPYGPDVEIKKEECIGHYQKRSGTALRRKLKEYKGLKLSDGKALSGRGRLTIERVDYFQFLFGRAIKANLDTSPEEMSRAIMAILMHYADPPDHSYCLDGPDSTCSFKRDPESHIPTSNPLPEAVVEVIKPVFTRLANPVMLKGLMHSGTQNAIEALHSTVWRLAPKETYHSAAEIKLGICMGIVQYSCGLETSAKALMQACGVPYGKHSAKTFATINEQRCQRVVYQNREEEKDRRKAHRYRKRKRNEAFSKEETHGYSSGKYHGPVNVIPCKCGSLEHSRTNNKNCPLNKKNNK